MELAIDSLGDGWGSAVFVLVLLSVLAVVSLGLWQMAGDDDPKVVRVRQVLLPVFLLCTAILTVVFLWHVVLAL